MSDADPPSASDSCAHPSDAENGAAARLSAELLARLHANREEAEDLRLRIERWAEEMHTRLEKRGRRD